ncbi:29 kDa ribonucleoprotein A, chloroplastic-like, partial [Nymphaea colorata]
FPHEPLSSPSFSPFLLNGRHRYYHHRVGLPHTAAATHSTGLPNTFCKAPICSSVSPFFPSFTFIFISSTEGYPSQKKPLPKTPLYSARSRGCCDRGAQSSVEDDSEAAEQKSAWTARKRLYAENLPLSLTEADIRSLFEQCGTVKKVELVKHKDGKSRGFSFITLSTPDEAFSAIDKLDSIEIGGRIIRVSYAKTAKKPPTAKPTAVETRHKIYASNLAWKVRSSHLREFFMANSNPVSAKVVFDSPSGKSAGYGFVSFATKEEAEAAALALDGKELMGRPLRLKISRDLQTNPEDVANKPDNVSESSKVKEPES